LLFWGFDVRDGCFAGNGWWGLLAADATEIGREGEDEVEFILLNVVVVEVNACMIIFSYRPSFLLLLT